MKKPDLHILMLEDEILDIELNKSQLALLDEYNCVVTVVRDRMSYLQALKTSSPDVILSDYNLPQYNGLNALKDLKEMNLVIPFIFVTGTMSEETAAETIKTGAWDYVVKDRLFRLPLAVRSVLKLKEEKLAALMAENYVRRLLTAIDQTSAQIIVGNDKGDIEYVNKKFTEVTGLTPGNLLGANIYDPSNQIFPAEALKEISETLKRGEVYTGEMKNISKDGSDYWWMLSVSPIRDESGNLVSFVAVKEDITSRKNIEEQLIKALDKAERSDRLKDVFLQNLSHEIRTPLNAIVGFSNLLSQENTSGITKEYTSIIKDSSHQLLTIVSDILTISSIQTGQETVNVKPVNLRSLFKRLQELFSHTAKEKGLKFHVALDKKELDNLILTDETKLGQILTNLLSNAFKFTHSGSVSLDMRVQGESISFSVEDTGIGISPESLAIIFERFRQAEDTTHIAYGGTGLGLSISKSFSQMLGGVIAVKSEQGKGSVFSLSLPYRVAADLVPHEEKHSVIPENKKISILIAEDEINNYLLIKALLNKPNLHLLYAENGLEAIKACEAHPEIDMILMDIKMPVMDGISAFQKIREIRKELPVIAQTAYGLEKEKQQFLELGFTDYIAKPIKKEMLYGIIRKCLPVS